jgi:phage tail sheath protein FI
MPGEQFFHGAEVIESKGGSRPIEVQDTSAIGVIGTAPDADPLIFPLDTPVLITGKAEQIAALDPTNTKKGTLPEAIDGIYDQAKARVVVIRVADGLTPAETQAKIIGGVDGTTGKRTGLQALLDSRSVTGVKPKIVIAPGFSQVQAVGTEMSAIVNRLRAVAYIDGPNTTDAAAIALRQQYSSKRVEIVDPWVKVLDTASADTVVVPASARAAGLRARVDQEEGFWVSKSNHGIEGIVGTARAIDYEHGDYTSTANLLNADRISTIINIDGWRYWGNQNCSDDTRFKYETTVRIGDAFADALLAAHLWAIDRNVTKSYVDDVIEGIERFIREMTRSGAILGGKVVFDKATNMDGLKSRKARWDISFTEAITAEHIIFGIALVDDYIEEIFK